MARRPYLIKQGEQEFHLLCSACGNVMPNIPALLAHNAAAHHRYPVSPDENGQYSPTPATIYHIPMRGVPRL